MLLEELGMAMHGERLARWSANRPQVTMLREASSPSAAPGPSRLSAALAKSGRALSQLLGGGHPRTAGPDGGAR